MREFENAGRKLLVLFTCRRCGKTHVEDLKPVCERSGDHYDLLRHLKPPHGWSDENYGTWLLCDECTEALKAFYRNGKKE